MHKSNMISPPRVQEASLRYLESLAQSKKKGSRGKANENISVTQNTKNVHKMNQNQKPNTRE